jgi:hypothetical protein
MNEVWSKVISCSDAIIERLSHTGVESTGINDARFPWKDRLYSSHIYRRAHLNIVDARDSHKLWMMHCTIFPHLHDSSPIFGLDIIAGPTRISGAFHDFSKTGNPNHSMMHWFDQRVVDLNWKKERELPDWAKQIFSPAMVAIGAVDNLDEIDQLIEVVLTNLDYYLENVGSTQDDLFGYTDEQNRYCYYQKQNPHNPRVMQSLGLSEEDAKSFVEEIMFPEII